MGICIVSAISTWPFHAFFLRSTLPARFTHMGNLSHVARPIVRSKLFISNVSYVPWCMAKGTHVLQRVGSTSSGHALSA